MKAKILIRTSIITLGVLLVPFIAMQFGTGVNWSLSDFIIMGVLLFATILAFSLAAASSGDVAYGVATCVAIATAFLLIWVNLAVGILGSGPNYANLMYGGMIVTGISGAVLSDFRAHGMARTMFTMALIQVLVPVVVFAIFQLERMPGEKFEETTIVVGVTGFFTVLWFISALLFRRAETRQAIETGA